MSKLYYTSAVSNIKIVNSIHMNLKNFLIFDKSDSSIVEFKPRKCCNSDCSICSFYNTDNFININNEFQLSIMSYSNCNSSNCIYIIHCKYCDNFYIGQTGRKISVRISEHLNNIKKHIIFKNKQNSEVALHFSENNHDHLIHFEFYIFKSNINNKLDRLYIENDLIHIFHFFKTTVINNYIPPYFYMKKLITFP